MNCVLLCRPTYFRVEYKINPWMKIGSVNQSNALKQWEHLMNIYKQLGVQVKIIEQNKQFPDMVFAADQGMLVNDKHILLSSFKYPQRRGESAYYKDWYERNGFTVTVLPDDLYFEGGGELQHWRDTIIVGTGFRTSTKAADYVAKVFDRSVIKLKLVDPQYYHLDTCLLVLNDTTIFYYPPAFAPESRLLLETMVPNLLHMSKKEAGNFAANSVVIGHTVIMQKDNPTIAKQIKKCGYNLIPLSMSEFALAGGGIHCLTGDLGNE